MGKYIEKVVEIVHHGRKIYGVSYLPNLDSKAPIVIFSHGYNGSYAHSKQQCESLAQVGIGAYCFDFCGGSVQSKSELKTTDMTLFTEKEDLNAVIDAVKTWEQVDADRIFLFGASQGGLISALVADERPDDIQGLILLFPALCIPANWNERFLTLESIPDTLELWGMTLGRVFFETIHGYDSFNHIGKYNKGVLMLQGDRDDIVALRDSERAAAMYSQAELVIFEGEGHGFTEEGNQRVIELTEQFLQANR